MNITLQFRGVCGGRKWRLQKIAFDEALKPRKQVVKGYESNISTPPTDVNLHSTNFFNLNHILKRINVEPVFHTAAGFVCFGYHHYNFDEFLCAGSCNMSCVCVNIAILLLYNL